MIHSTDLQLVMKEMAAAEDKHPEFPEDVVKMVAIVAEECGEAVREANHIDEGHGDIHALRQELYQTIGTCFRVLSNTRKQLGKEH